MSDHYQSLLDTVRALAQEVERPLVKASRQDADDAEDDAAIRLAASGDADDDGEPDSEDIPDDYDLPATADPASREGRAEDGVGAEEDGFEDEEDKDEEDESAEDAEGEDELFGKSYRVALVDGGAIDAVDGRAVIRRLSAQLRKTQAALNQIAEAMRYSTTVLKSLRADNAALKQQVAALRKAGRGRRSVLSVHDKPAAGFNAAPPSPRELMAKALAAHRAGRITSVDVARVEAYLGRGASIPEPLLTQISSS